ncbi:MAG: hypothetical protein VCF07_13660 [Nitrospinota bacterium]
MKIRRRNHSPVEKGKTFRKNKPSAVQAHPERSVLMVHLEIKDKIREAGGENSVLEAAPFRVLREMARSAAGMTTGSPSGQGGSKKYSK